MPMRKKRLQQEKIHFQDYLFLQITLQMASKTICTRYRQEAKG